MKARDLAALAALGAVGYHLSKGKGKKDEEDAVDASPEKLSRQEKDVPEALSRQERDVPDKVDKSSRQERDVPEKVESSGSTRKTDLRLPAGGGTGDRSVTSKPAVVKSEVEKEYGLGNEGRRTSSTGDKIAAINAKSGAASPSARQVDALRATSRKAAAEDTAKRRTSGTLPQIQAPGTQSMARYPGGLAKRGANVSVPEDKPITRILGTDQDYVDAITATAPVGLAAKLAAKMAYKKDKPLNYYDQPALGGPSTPLLGAPAKQLTGPSKTDLMARDRANRASERQDAMTRENADRYGLNPNAPGYDAAASSLRDRMGGRDFTLKKKGGVIKKMASGGMTSRGSSASNRGDGIAQRGKTRGSMR